MRALLLVAAGTVFAVTPDQPDVREIVLKALLKDSRNDARLRDYTYLEHIEERQPRSGAASSRTYEVLHLYGRPFRVLVARDGKPLTPKESGKEKERLAKATAERRRESPQQRAKRESQYLKNRLKERAFLREIPEAYHLRLTGTELMDGQEVWLVEAEPRPEYKPKDTRARILQKFKGKMWIEKSESQVVRVEAEAIDTASFGWVLARLNKGSRFEFRLTRLNDGIWVPRRVFVQVNARLALLKSYNAERTIIYRDYRRFQTDSRVVSTAEMPESR